MKIENCNLCDNCIKRKNIVNGIGNINSNVIFIFDHPRYKQDRTGLFISSEDLNKFIGYLSDYGFNEFNSYFTFLVKCRPVRIHNFYNAIEICSNAHLNKEYIYNGKRKKLMVTVGRDVSNYIFNNRSYKNFTAYDMVSAVVPIPDASWFAKGGQINANRLKSLKKIYDSINQT